MIVRISRQSITHIPHTVGPTRWLAVLFGLALLLAVSTGSWAQAADGMASATSDSAPDDPVLTMFPHSQTSRWWVSGQDNIIMQWHPSFDAKYSGPNSFRAHPEHATSNIGTLFTGVQLTGTTEIFMHFEMADGGGISGTADLTGPRLQARFDWSAKRTSAAAQGHGGAVVAANR